MGIKYFLTTNIVSINLSICGVDSPDDPIDIPLVELKEYPSSDMLIENLSSALQVKFTQYPLFKYVDRKPFKCSPESESIISEEITQLATSLNVRLDFLHGTKNHVAAKAVTLGKAMTHSMSVHHVILMFFKKVTSGNPRPSIMFGKLSSEKLKLAPPRQACSSQIQIQYLSNTTKITSNTETAMLSSPTQSISSFSSNGECLFNDGVFWTESKLEMGHLINKYEYCCPKLCNGEHFYQFIKMDQK